MPQDTESFKDILRHAKEPSGLLKILLREVEGCNDTRKVTGTGWPWIAGCQDLVHIRMALFVRQLFKHRAWWKGLELVYVDLSLFDHDNDPTDLGLTWTIGHRLGRHLNQWDQFLDLYRTHVAKNGTSVLKRNYLLGLGRLPKPDIESVRTDFTPDAECEILEPSKRSIGAAEVRVGGKPLSYLTSVILKHHLDGNKLQRFVQYHFQAGLEDRPAAPQRDACSANLYLTFLDPAGRQGKKDASFEPAKKAIQDQLLRIAGLYLLEKSRKLRTDIESAREREEKRNEALRRDVNALLKRLKVVESGAQSLRQSLVGPLARFQNWVTDLLPKLFDEKTGSLRSLRGEFPAISPAHNQEMWKREHLVVAFWLLCAPPVAERASLTARRKLVEQGHWAAFIAKANRTDPADPWLFCAHAYASLADGQVPALAEVFKRIQRNRRDPDGLRLDLGILQFLLGQEITARGQELAGYDVPPCWQESVFVGVPRLAQTVAKAAAKVAADQVDCHPSPRLTLCWPVLPKVGRDTDLLASVAGRISELLALAGRAKAAGSEASTSELLREVAGKNDQSNAIVRVMLPETSLALLEVEATGPRVVLRSRDPAKGPLAMLVSDSVNLKLAVYPHIT